ncbi:MAG: hypothetical protein KDE27_16145 [Planctomycetes bacterium]|nr:hypothetical protein [Planctomycetota bacterium]
MHHLAQLLLPGLAAALSAQSALIYDNGPLVSVPGLSVAEFAALGHTTLGWSARRNNPPDIACLDEFAVPTAMVVEEIEYYTYQTGAGTGPSTITGAFLAIYDVDPRLGGQPIGNGPQPTFDLFSTPNNPVLNSWSGVFRVYDNNLGATDRAIMQVRVKLEDTAGTPTPLTLGPGTYWLQLQSTGSLPSGPFVPAVVCTGQRVTGNAFNAIGMPPTYVAITNSGDRQGVPFKLFGSSAGSSGTIAQVANGCGASGLTVCGAPVIGGFVRTTLSPSSATGLSVIGYDLVATPTPFCGCTAIHAFPIAVWLTTAHAIQIPLDAAFAGLPIAIQGAEFLGTGGGCPNPPVNLTDAFVATLGS